MHESKGTKRGDDDLIRQVQLILCDQRRELRNIKNKEQALDVRKGDLCQARKEVIRGIDDAERILQQFDYE